MRFQLRPPQPAAYLFVLDVSHNAVESGYLKYLCESLLDNLDRLELLNTRTLPTHTPALTSSGLNLRGGGRLCLRLPGDARTKVGFLTFDNTIHFYNLQEKLSQPQMLVVSDIDGTTNFFSFLFFLFSPGWILKVRNHYGWFFFSSSARCLHSLS